VSLVTVLVSAAVGIVASVVTAYATAHLTARQEMRRWYKELAGKYAELAADHPVRAQALARQFAVGVLILEAADQEHREKFFVAPHTRMTAGRSKDNELVLPTDYASTRHFSISADDSRVYVEDLGSTNGVYLNDSRVVRPTILNSGDIIRISDDCRIEFQSLPSRR
jgi:FHA domain